STGDSSGPGSVAVGDFNNDGRIDIAVANFLTNNVGILLGYGNGNFSSQTAYPTGINSYTYWLAVGDFNNDGRSDIAVFNYGTNNVGILVGKGDGRLSSQITYPTSIGSNPVSITVDDFNNDNRLDIAVVNFGQDNVDVLLGYGNGTFPCISGTDSYPTSVAIGA